MAVVAVAVVVVVMAWAQAPSLRMEVAAQAVVAVVAALPLLLVAVLRSVEAKSRCPSGGVEAPAGWVGGDEICVKQTSAALAIR